MGFPVAKARIALISLLLLAPALVLAIAALMLWTELRLRPILLLLAQDEAGAQLMTQAFAGDPDEMGALISWVEAERRRISGPS